MFRPTGTGSWSKLVLTTTKVVYLTLGGLSPHALSQGSILSGTL